MYGITGWVTSVAGLPYYAQVRALGNGVVPAQALPRCGCWQQWGLKACRAGRHLRFRERHVEEWLRSREA